MEKNLKIGFLVVLLTVSVCYGKVEIAQIWTNDICHSDGDCQKVLNCSALFPPKRGCTRVGKLKLHKFHQMLYAALMMIASRL
ncbi:unnamed protein product [Lupinus luteus]|uniref:Uncharacterized protein n=1 Tax=Lupinus luteus TaxID=3873 RepID=A0AAV1VWA2_LUPLU